MGMIARGAFFILTLLGLYAMGLGPYSLFLLVDLTSFVNEYLGWFFADVCLSLLLRL